MIQIVGLRSMKLFPHHRAKSFACKSLSLKISIATQRPSWEGKGLKGLPKDLPLELEEGSCSFGMSLSWM